MTPQHHPDPDEFLAYAAGATEEWHSLVLACHLTFCAQCRDELAFCDALGGALLEDFPERGVPPTTTHALPARQEKSTEATPILLPDVRLPRPLRPYFRDVAPRWRFLAPGVRHIPLSIEVNGRPLRVVEFRPSYVVPQHAHGGGETLVIFHGSIRDSRDDRVYRRGDVYRSEAGSSHVQTIGSDASCISLVVNEGPLVPASFVGRVLQWITGI